MKKLFSTAFVILVRTVIVSKIMDKTQIDTDSDRFAVFFLTIEYA